MEERASQSVAVVGVACRLPGGVRCLDDLGALLAEDRDVVGPPPPWRLDPAMEAGLLADDLRDFDAEFFEISPGEAEILDPQQRLILELAREAVDDAGLGAEALRRRRTGVYVGIGGSDFKALLTARDGRPEPWLATSVLGATAVGRVAYWLGTTGPAIAVDTACSSSGVALHLACRALAAREVDVALAGGVNLLLDPAGQAALRAMGALSPGHRCRAFDAEGDGYGRGEGGALLVLVREEDVDALAPLGWILGSACNADGRTNGLTAPSGRAQQAVLREALSAARVRAEEVVFHACHGTGTALGDAVELEALAAVHRLRDQPLWLGAIKSRIGHLEAAASVASVLEALAVGRSGRVPARVGVRTPHPGLVAPLALPEAPEDLASPGPMTVSTFGIGGTNACFVLRPEPAEVASVEAEDAPELLVLSARREEPLRALAGSVAARLEAGLGARSVCATAALGRSHDVVRLAVVGCGAELIASLPGAAVGRAGAPRVAFLFPGQGSARPLMAMSLAARFPQARAVLDRCFDVADPLLPVPLSQVMASEDPGWTDDTRLVQPALFAASLAVAELLRSWGVEPAAVAGHSVGEWAAAAFAGVFDPDDALRAVVARGLAMHEAPFGAMAALFAPERVVATLLGEAEIAAVNGPHETVITGSEEAVDRAVRAAEQAGVAAARLRVRRGFHSSLVAPAVQALRPALRGLDPALPSLQVFSAVSAAEDPAALLNLDAWAEQLRAPVRFGDTVSAMAGSGVDTWVDLGASSALSAAVGAQLPGARVIGAAGEPSEEVRRALGALGALYTAGLNPDWEAVFAPAPRRVRLPSQPLVPSRHWPTGVGAVATCWELVWTELAPGEAVPGPVRVQGSEALVQALRERGVDADARDGADPVERDGGAHVVHVAGPGTAADEALAAVEAVRAALRASAARLSFVTTGVAGWAGDGVAQAAVHGVARVAMSEHPELGVALFDAPDPARAAPWLAAPAGAQVAVRELPMAASLSPVRLKGGAAVSGLWVITGGFGALGRATAAWLAERGAEAVVLVGRRAGSLPALRCSVRGVAADVATAEGLAILEDALAGQRIAGVVHAAGVLDDAALHRVEPDSLRRVFAPKVEGAARLAAWPAADQATLVLFSSLAALAGTPGQAAYASANAVMDAIACERRAAGRRVVSVGWGAWAGGGMASDKAHLGAGAGLAPLEPAAALEALGLALAADRAWIGVFPEPSADQGAPPIFSPPASAGGRPALSPTPTEDRWAEVPAAAREEAVLALIVAEAARLLGRPAASVPAHEELATLGLDSLQAISLRNAMLAEGLEVPLHLVVGGASAARLASAAVAARWPDVEPDAAQAASGEVPLGAVWTHALAALAGAAATLALWGVVRSISG